MSEQFREAWRTYFTQNGYQPLEKQSQNATLDKLVQEKTTLLSLVKGRADELRGELNQMKNKEVDSVAPYLFRIFSKLVKHSTLDG